MEAEAEAEEGEEDDEDVADDLPHAPTRRDLNPPFPLPSQPTLPKGCTMVGPRVRESWKK